MALSAVIIILVWLIYTIFGIHLVVLHELLIRILGFLSLCRVIILQALHTLVLHFVLVQKVDQFHVLEWSLLLHQDGVPLFYISGIRLRMIVGLYLRNGYDILVEGLVVSDQVILVNRVHHVGMKLIKVKLHSILELVIRRQVKLLRIVLFGVHWVFLRHVRNLVITNHAEKV